MAISNTGLNTANNVDNSVVTVGGGTPQTTVAYVRNLPGSIFPDGKKLEAILDYRYRVPGYADLNIEASGDFTSQVAANAVILYPASYQNVHAVAGLAWSYTGIVAGSKVQLEDGAGNIMFSQQITSAGPGFINFSPAEKGSPGRSMIATLFAGATGATGSLNVLGHRLE